MDNNYEDQTRDDEQKDLESSVDRSRELVDETKKNYGKIRRLGKKSDKKTGATRGTRGVRGTGLRGAAVGTKATALGQGAASAGAAGGGTVVGGGAAAGGGVAAGAGVGVGIVVGIVVAIILFLIIFVVVILGGENQETTSIAEGGCESISASSYIATPTEPTILTAINCQNIPTPLTYQWTASDTAGTLSVPTGEETTYTPSSDTIKDVTITLAICNATDIQNCSTDTILINGSSATAQNVKYYCQYASAWQASGCSIANYGCTQSAAAMAMSTYRSDNFYNPLKVAIDNGKVYGCTRGTTISAFNDQLVTYMKSAGYDVAPSVASGTSFNISLAKNYIDQGYVIVAGGSVWFNSNKQIVPGGHAFLIVGADPTNNTLSVFDPTYCPWLDGDVLSKGTRTMAPETYSCSYTSFDSNNKPIASNCLSKDAGGNKYVFYISNGGHGWYYARPVKKQ